MRGQGAGKTRPLVLTGVAYMPKFVVKNPFYWRGKLVNPGAVIDVPKGLVDDLACKDVLGEPAEDKPPAREPKTPETATAPSAPEKAVQPGPAEAATQSAAQENAALPNAQED